ncbi:MBL fold metallo-hydrolase [Exilibacterium tricleocarpae]|nr:MBL fold metallo-hydrolase [Exilibacterium tricleocarpae]
MFSELGSGIYCIDADYVRRGLACFYLLYHRGEIAIIETGTSHSLPHLQQLMASKSMLPEQVRYVIPTHVHLDHAGGAGAMMAAFPEAELVVHPQGARHLIDPAKLIASTIAVYGEEIYRSLYGDIQPVAAERVIRAEDGRVLNLGGRALEIRDTPGHANHHFCVWDSHSRGWFSGDVFGISYPELRFGSGNFVLPTTTPTQFNPQALIKSVNLLLSYEPATVYLTHFSNIDEIEGAATLLCRQIEQYRLIALRLKEREDRVEAIRQALSEYTLQQLAGFIDTQAPAFYAGLLDMDMRLNAQGLEVWLARGGS